MIPSVQLHGKRGYVPKGLVREFKILTADVRHTVPTEFDITGTNASAEAVTQEQSPDTSKEEKDSLKQELPKEEPNQENVKSVAAPETPFEVVDGTTIYMPEDSPMQMTLTKNADFKTEEKASQDIPVVHTAPEVSSEQVTSTQSPETTTEVTKPEESVTEVPQPSPEDPAIVAKPEESGSMFGLVQGLSETLSEWMSGDGDDDEEGDDDEGEEEDEDETSEQDEEANSTEAVPVEAEPPLDNKIPIPTEPETPKPVEPEVTEVPKPIEPEVSGVPKPVDPESPKPVETEESEPVATEEPKPVEPVESKQTEPELPKVVPASQIISDEVVQIVSNTQDAEKIEEPTVTSSPDVSTETPGNIETIITQSSDANVEAAVPQENIPYIPGFGHVHPQVPVENVQPLDTTANKEETTKEQPYIANVQSDIESFLSSQYPDETVQPEVYEKSTEQPIMEPGFSPEYAQPDSTTSPSVVPDSSPLPDPTVLPPDPYESLLPPSDFAENVTPSSLDEMQPPSDTVSSPTPTPIFYEPSSSEFNSQETSAGDTKQEITGTATVEEITTQAPVQEEEAVEDSGGIFSSWIYNLLGYGSSDESVTTEASSTEASTEASVPVETTQAPVEQVETSSWWSWSSSEPQQKDEIQQSCSAELGCEDLGSVPNVAQQQQQKEEEVVTPSYDPYRHSQEQQQLWQTDVVSTMDWEAMVTSGTAIYLVVTAVAVLLFTLGHYYIEKMKKDGTLIARINTLQKELLVSSKECLELKDDLEMTKKELRNVEVTSTDSSEVVVTMREELEESQRIRNELEEQVAGLEKELEAATEAGLELNKMLSEFLSAQKGSEDLSKSMEMLQQQLNTQQATISSTKQALNAKILENEELTLELAEASEQITKLEAEVSKVSEHLAEVQIQKQKLKEDLEESCVTLANQLQESAQQRETDMACLKKQLEDTENQLKEVEKNLLERTSQVEVLETSLKQLQQLDNSSSEEGQKKLQALLDVGKAQAELKLVRSECDVLKERLQGEEDARQLLEDHVAVIKVEVEKLRERHELAEREKLEAQTKLDVLSSYFKEKETQLQKELGLQEAMFEQKKDDVTVTHVRIKTLEDEISTYKLTLVEKGPIVAQNGDDGKPTQRLDSNGELQLPTSPILHIGDSPSMSPPHLGGPPPPYMMPPPPLPGTFMPPPPPPEFLHSPPPPLPLYPDRRPPPLGRMSSPPPHHFSPPPPDRYVSPYRPRSPASDRSLPRYHRYSSRSPSPPPYDYRRYPHAADRPWDDEPRAGFRPLHRDKDPKGGTLSSGHSSESLEKLSRHSKS
ncbi:hypothetical protein B566_EDAN016933 [Ephemera danica]|nr:hypothetical protein B566_EDAN016933 [Ephemera danica]